MHVGRSYRLVDFVFWSRRRLIYLEIELRQRLGDTELPQPLPPVDDIAT